MIEFLPTGWALCSVVKRGLWSSYLSLCGCPRLTCPHHQGYCKLWHILCISKAVSARKRHLGYQKGFLLFIKQFLLNSTYYVMGLNFVCYCLFGGVRPQFKDLLCVSGVYHHPHVGDVN